MIWAVGSGAAYAQPVPSGQGTVTVETRDSLTQVPLPGVRVTLQGGEPGVMSFSMVHSTGADGSFPFPELPAGNYRLKSEHPGYLPAEQVVRLGAGEATERARLDLVPFGSLEGTVSDEEGHPIAGVTVYTRQPGRMPQDRGNTDGTGHFLVKSLAPGDYRLELKVPYDVRRARLQRNADSGEVFGYPSVSYYPGVAEAEGAIEVHATAGVALRGMDARLRRVRLVDFTGKLIDRITHDPALDATLGLVTPGSPHADHNYMPRKPAGDGGFHFDLVQPGQYDVAVYTGMNGTSGFYTANAMVPVFIGKTGVADMVISPPVLQRVTARVQPLPDGKRWQGPMKLRLLGVGIAREVELKDEGEFAIDGLPPGQWRVELTGRPTRVVDRRVLAVADARFGAQDALVGRITIAESGNPVIEVTLTDATGQIAGGFEGKDVRKENAVYLRRTGQAAIRMEFIKSDGTFGFDGLAPGTYELAARVEGTAVDPNEPLTRVEVKAGETAGVVLK